MTRVLVAGVGNVLRGDDGFGPAVIAALDQRGTLPEGVRTVDVGIGGFGLIRELLDGYDALLIVDAVDRGRAPGTMYVMQPEVPPLDAIDDQRRRALAADAHQAVPDRALLVASASGVLPPRVWIIGCQPAEVDELCTELSPAVRSAVDEAAGMIDAILADLNVSHG
jgi:hydrogenase maturation protease